MFMAAFQFFWNSYFTDGLITVTRRVPETGDPAETAGELFALRAVVIKCIMIYLRLPRNKPENPLYESSGLSESWFEAEIFRRTE